MQGISGAKSVSKQSLNLLVVLKINQEKRFNIFIYWIDFRKTSKAMNELQVLPQKDIRPVCEVFL